MLGHAWDVAGKRSTLDETLRCSGAVFMTRAALRCDRRLIFQRCNRRFAHCAHENAHEGRLD